MPKYDCLVLYNKIEESTSQDEDYFSEASVRDEVYAVEEALHELGFSPGLIAIERVDRELMATLQKLAPRFVFNLCEGLAGRSDMEMCVAGLLELLGLPYTGSPPLALGLALDKFRAKRLLSAARIRTPRCWLFQPGDVLKNSNVKFPAIVKPVREDASLGVTSSSVVKNAGQLQRQVDYIHSHYSQPALVEEYIDGRELNVALLGGPTPQVLPISEIDFSGLPENEPRIVSYQAKWVPLSPLYQNTVPVCPAALEPRLESRVAETARRAFLEIGCRDYARVDIRLDARGCPYVLEVNPNPDISPSAGLARSAQAAGLSYTELIGRIVECVLARSGKETKVAYAS